MRTYTRYTLDDYEITREGQVINKHTGKALRPQPNDKGYGRVCIGKKFYFVHRLVAELYVPNPEGKPQVNHINGDKTDNRAENLEWVTNKENRSHAVKNRLHTQGESCSWSRLTENDVRYIREHQGEMTIKAFTEMFNVSRSTIADVIYRRTWKAS